MPHIDWKQLTKRRAIGAAVMVLGAVIVFMAIFAGEWVLSLIGIVLIAAGLFQVIETLRAGNETETLLAYITGAITILLGLVLLISPRVAISGVLLVVSLFFLIDGVTKIVRSFRETGRERWWILSNGVVVTAFALVLWYFLSVKLGILAVGLVLGFRLLMEGWTMVLLPEKGLAPPDAVIDTRVHPDPRLNLEPSDAIATMQDRLIRREHADATRSIVACVTFFAIFFMIHVLRTDAQWSFIGFISPFSAVVGDAMVALVSAVVILLPLRLVWRKLTRPVERLAWGRIAERPKGNSPIRWLTDSWLATRMRFSMDMREARTSLNFAFWRVLRIGLPITAILIAINSIWGFSWYFNSENWASGVWQEITKARVDAWRQRAAIDVERDAIARGVPAEMVFQVAPDGVAADGDFSFIVIGDTGEGDSSQMSLREQLIAASNRENVKFLVVSSDVIYPDGKMKDYETNFYLPFMGFTKPIYAIPGNHDWYDADEGFNANFLDRDAALLSLKARLEADLNTDLFTPDQRFIEMTDEAERLRGYYGVQNGRQRAPFFEMHTAGFSLVAIDTGIMRRIDEKQRAWLESALARSKGSFTMVVIGHPFYVAGNYQATDDAEFRALDELLRRSGARVIMAGDTHDFEYYRLGGEAAAATPDTHYFVNGGGGAYLSIGTALGYSENPATPDYAFYPPNDDLRYKLRTQSPGWKMPFLAWMKYFHGWPFDTEMVSGAFDFNRAPFFQSFVEVNVERSKGQVRYALCGVKGPLLWRDVDVAGAVKPPDKSDDDPVEFVVKM